jgi:hypothetical protein
MSSSEFVATFGNLIYLFNNVSSIEHLSNELNKYLSHDLSIKFDHENAVASEVVKFLNGLIPIMGEDQKKNASRIRSTLSKLGINNQFVTVDNMALCLNEKIEHFKMSKFNSNLVSFDWQINVLDRKNDNVNLNKSEKIEIVTKINAFNDKSQKYESNVVKMSLNEFEEILNNFKQIDNQLHLLKQ